MKNNQTIKSVVNEAKGTITFIVKDAGEVVFDLAKASEKNRAYAALHGFKQRLQDAAALSCDTKTGKSASPQEKYEAIQKMAAHYESGTEDWNVVREGGAGGGRISYLAEALAQVKEMEVEVIREWLKDRTPKEKAALEELPAIKAIIDSKRKATTAGVDAGALIAGLMTFGKPTTSL